MGFIAFILVMAVLSAFFEVVEDISELAPFISVFLAFVAGYRITRRAIERNKAEQEKNRREDLKEELRQELKEELRQEAKQGSIQQTAEEPWIPETKYLNR